MDDRQLLTPVAEWDSQFKPLNTVPIFALHFLFTIALEVTAIVYAIIHPDVHSKCKEYFTLLYMHVGFWFLTLVSNIIIV